jgi:GTPase SAR1 family protein
MVVFDLTDRESFVNVDGWLNEIEKHCGTDVSVIVLANKVDIAQKQASKNENNEYNEEDDQEREIEVTDEDIA